MRTSILACALLVMSAPAMANDFEASVTNFNLNYSSPSGQATSSSLSYDQYHYPSYTQYSVELQGGILTLETPDELIQLDNLPDVISEVDTINIAGLDLTSNQSLVALSANQLRTQSTDSSLDITRLSIDCGYKSSNDTFTNELLDSCFNNSGDISLGSYKSDGKEVVGDTEFTIRNNSMTFQMKAQGLKIKGNGKTYFQNNQVRIRVDKAKVGFLNVRGRLFKELEKLESEKVSVNEPWIEFQLK